MQRVRPNDLPSLEMARIIERVEANATADMVRAAPADLVEDVRLTLSRINSAIAVTMEEIDWPMFNRVLCLGLDEPASEADIDAIVDVYRHTQMIFPVMLSPLAQPQALPSWLKARGIALPSYSMDRWVKFYRGVEPPPDVPTAFRIVCVEDDEQALTWAGTVSVACYIHRACLLWTYRMVGRPGWRHYLAYDGTEPVATAALYIQDSAGWLGFGGTFRSRQRRGAQSALIAQRIRDAAALGCRWLTVETKEDTPQWPSPSFRNMLRAGFQIAYLRPHYRLKAKITRDVTPSLQESEPRARHPG